MNSFVSNPQRIATNSSAPYLILEMYSVFQTLKGSLQTLLHHLSSAPYLMCFKPSKDRYKLWQFFELNNYTLKVSNPQRIATNKGEANNSLIEVCGFKPSKDRYKLSLAQHLRFLNLCFKPSKDRYKPSWFLQFSRSSTTVSNPQRITTNRNFLDFPSFVISMVSNPQRIATNQKCGRKSRRPSSVSNPQRIATNINRY